MVGSLSLNQTPKRQKWEMLPGYPSCMCSTSIAELPSELAPGKPSACNHLYVKKSLGKDIFRVSVGTAVGSASSPGGNEAERPQGVRVLRGGPMTIVIHPTAGRPSAGGGKEMAARVGQSGPTFASLADERAADDLGVLLMGVSRTGSPCGFRKRALPFRRTSSAESRSRKCISMQPVTLKMPSRAFEVDIKLEKSLKDAKVARSANQLTGRTCMVDPDEEKENSIRCYKHTISSLISSRIGDMNRESRMLQESQCKRKGAHHPRRPLQSDRKSTAPGRPTHCMYDSFTKQLMLRPRQFSFH